MIAQFLRVLTRLFKKDPITYFINVFGMALGLTCFIVIFLHVRHEYSFDRFHQNSDQIYRITTKYREYFNGSIPGNMATRLSEEAEGQFAFTRFFKNPLNVKVNNTIFKEEVTFADNDFFQIFSFPVVQGNRADLLRDLNQIVITKEIAQKYFDETEPIGQRISVKIENAFIDFIVSGILEKAPKNSGIQYSILMPFERLKEHSWYRITHFFDPGMQGPAGFVKLNKNWELPRLQERVNQIHKSQTVHEFQKELRYHFLKLKDLHFANYLAPDVVKITNPVYIKILIGLGVLIILIAIINYVNFSLSQAGMRYKEIGIRKVAGASSRTLFLHYVFESIGITLIAAVLSVVLIECFVQGIINFIGFAAVPTKELGNWGVLAFLIILFGTLGGAYPAFFLSRRKPVEVLKKMQVSTRFHAISRIFILFQYSISIGLLLCTFIMQRQLNYATKGNLGFSQDQKLILPAENVTADEVKRIKSRLLQLSEIQNVSASSEVPTGPLESMFFYSRKDAETACAIWDVESNFVKTLEIPIIAGKDFTEGMGNDKIIVNTEFMRRLGIKDYENVWVKDHIASKKRQIVGVVNDFHFLPLQRKIEPLVFYTNTSHYNHIIIALNCENFQKTKKEIEKIWQETLPNHAFSFSFLNEKIEQQYQTEKQWIRILTISSLLAIAIACFGLLGLTRIIINKRTKEIGIRKVLGASIVRLFSLLSNEFTRLILLANLVAWPIAWYAMHKWLQNFVYRVDMSWWPFALSGGLTLLMALLTVSWQAVRAARANPVEALRYE